MDKLNDSLHINILQLVIVDFMEFHFVHDWGVRWYSVGAGDELVGEVETVFAACVHELESSQKALEHGSVQGMDNGFAVAVGLFDYLIIEQIDTLEIKADAFPYGGFGTVALFDYFVIIAFGGFR